MPRVESKLPEDEVPRALTLTNLLIVTTFILTVMSVVVPIRASHGGASRYIAGIVAGLSSGTCVVWTEWQILKFLFEHVSNGSKKKEYLISTIALFVLIAWLIVGGVVGDQLGSFLIKRIH